MISSFQLLCLNVWNYHFWREDLYLPRFVRNGEQIPLFYEPNSCECSCCCRIFYYLAPATVFCCYANLLPKRTNAASVNSRRPCVMVFLALTATFPLLLVWHNCATDVPHSPRSLSLPPLLLQEVQNLPLNSPFCLSSVSFFLSTMLLQWRLIFGGNKRKRQDVARDFYCKKKGFGFGSCSSTFPSFRNKTSITNLFPLVFLYWIRITKWW